MHFGQPAEIFGVDGIIILIVVVVVLFGSTQIPKLARSLGSAQKEFKKGLDEGSAPDPKGDQSAATAVAPPAAPAAAPPVAPVVAPPAVTPPAAPAEPASEGSTGSPS